MGGFRVDNTGLNTDNLKVESGGPNTAKVVVGKDANSGGINSADKGTDIVFWAGATHPNRATAPFRVNAQGDLTAESATIDGVAINTKGAFGGDGSDGALTLTSGATNIDLGNVKVLTKNYTSISITGSGQLTFTNPHATGSIIILKSQGAVTLTSSADPNIQASSLGAPGGGSATDGTTAVPLADPGTAHGGVSGGGTGAGGAVYASAGFYTIDAGRYRSFGRFLACGSGGGGSQGPGGGSGGRGGGALVIECAGALNCTGNIDVEGGAGTLAGNGYGGGGSGGSCLIFYNTQTAVSGTISDAGGAGGSGSNDGGGGAGGIGGAGGTRSVGISGGGAGGGGAGGAPDAGAASTSADHFIQI